MATANQTAKTPAKNTKSKKPRLIKMYNAEQDKSADVHPEMVSNYEAGGYVKK